MKRFSILTGILLTGILGAGSLFMLSLAASPVEPQKDKEQQTVRVLHGQVLDKADTPLEKAVVYLKNTRTLQVRSFITTADGNYHFSGLSPNVDYEVRAERDGTSSATRTVSAFDSRKDVALNLKIDAKK